MPYPADHKAKTRARIVQHARVLFNKRGFDQVSIDDVMKAAGLTRGGFYHHFASKDDLYAEAVRSFSSCNPFAKARAELDHEPSRVELAKMLVRLYLADETLEDVEVHCPLVALPSDVARAGLKPRAAYTQIVQSMLRVFRSAFPETDPRREEKARLVLNLCVGGMVIARTTDDPELRKSLRAAARAEGLALLSGDGKVQETEKERAPSRRRATVTR
ncbi:MAG TPA: TetR/AcrR family transcriptional regulator [Polyangiaceae bacterium]|nr:TetR/AcrR family transcriptional regulator [Polyangiaceae bacterium]